MGTDRVRVLVKASLIPILPAPYQSELSRAQHPGMFFFTELITFRSTYIQASNPRGANFEAVSDPGGQSGDFVNPVA